MSITVVKTDLNLLESKSDASVSHLAFLDGLRALAAIYVVLHHMISQIDTASDPIANMLIKPFKLGHYAVDVFIILSGFCLMLPVIKKGGNMTVNALTFFKKRAIRILPAYFLAMAISLLLIYTLIGSKTGTHWDVCIPVTHFDIISHIFLFQDFFYETSAKINHVFWSISVEWRIYLFFPLFVFSFKKFGSFYTTALLVVLSVAGWFLIRKTTLNASMAGINVHYVGLFALGMLAARISYSEEAIFKKIREMVPLKWFRIIIAMMAIAAIIVNGRITYWVFSDLTIGICTAFLLIGISSKSFDLLRTMLSFKPISFIGTFAYSIYLMHAPIIQIVSEYLIFPLHMRPLYSLLFLFFGGSAIVILISYSFFLIAEYPFIKKKIALEIR